jgi:hypothetical protein
VLPTLCFEHSHRRARPLSPGLPDSMRQPYGVITSFAQRREWSATGGDPDQTARSAETPGRSICCQRPIAPANTAPAIGATQNSQS